MITFNRGDIILVPFPFTNQKDSKKRPAVIVSSQAYNIKLVFKKMGELKGDNLIALQKSLRLILSL
ncbi:MAG: type II toxin-antitoxin system PemK/MazF family toxin [Gammaproteobacteria bacterium]|nr:type II toxin-antitoxin system PemK/MazF family toxin [Gammaproteobacteria bacterium]